MKLISLTSLLILSLLVVGNEANTIYIRFNLSFPFLTSTLPVEPSTTMREIKVIFAKRLGFPLNKLKIGDIDGKELSDDSTIEGNNIPNLSKLVITEV